MPIYYLIFAPIAYGYLLRNSQGHFPTIEKILKYMDKRKMNAQTKPIVEMRNIEKKNEKKKKKKEKRRKCRNEVRAKVK